MANNDQNLPKNPSLGFGKKPSLFSGNKGFGVKTPPGARFIPPQIRITQNKGGGGK